MLIKAGLELPLLFIAGDYMQEYAAQVRSLGWEDPLEQGMAIYSCVENPKDKGAWWAIVHRVAKSRTRQQLHFLSLYFKP